MKTLNNLEVGDILKQDIYKYKVLAVLPGLVALSFEYNHEKFFSWYTIKQLEEYGYTPEPEVKEMTVKEISEKLGYEVKIIKE